MSKVNLTQNIYASNLKSRAVLVMNYLIFRSNKENTCFPSIKTIAKDVHVSVNTVKRAMDDLVNAGFVKKAARFSEQKHGAQTSNLYTLCEVDVKPIENVIKEEKEIEQNNKIEFQIEAAILKDPNVEYESFGELPNSNEVDVTDMDSQENIGDTTMVNEADYDDGNKEKGNKDETVNLINICYVSSKKEEKSKFSTIRNQKWAAPQPILNHLELITLTIDHLMKKEVLLDLLIV